MTINTNPSAQPVSDGEAELEKMASWLRQASWTPSIDLNIHQSLDLAEMVLGTLESERNEIYKEAYQSGYAAAVGDAVACAPEKRLPESERMIPIDRQNKVDSNVLPLLQNSSYNEALNHYRTAIEKLGDKG